MNRRDFIKLAAVGGVVAGVATEAVAAPPVAKKWPFQVRWGLDGLDACTSMGPGELALVAGYAGSGKTALMMNAVEHTGGRTIYFDPNCDIGNRASKVLTEPARVLVRLGDFEHIFEQADEDEAVAKLFFNRFDLIVIDCVGPLRPSRSRSLYGECVKLKKLATLLNVPIIAGVQFNRPALSESVIRVGYDFNPSFDWMRPVDLLLRCNGGHGRTLIDGPAVNLTVLKNKFGAVGENFSHKLTPLLALHRCPC